MKFVFYGPQEDSQNVLHSNVLLSRCTLSHRPIQTYSIILQSATSFSMPRKPSTTVDTEWDLRVTLVPEQWKKAAKTIKKHVEVQCDNDDVVFLLVSGVEYGVSNVKRVQQGGDPTYHVHCALVMAKEIDRDTAISIMVGEKNPLFTNVYAVPRKRSTTYMGWVLHHTKSLTKEHSDSAYAGAYIASIGDCPEDAPTASNKRKILDVVKNYAIEQRAATKEVLDSWTLQQGSKQPLDTTERATKRRLYEKAYRSTPLQKSKREAYDRNRRWKSYVQLVEQFNNLEDKHGTECLVLYKKIQHLESTRWISEHMKEHAIQGVPAPVIHDIASDEE